MQLRRPDMQTHRPALVLCPDRFFFCVFQPGNGIGMADSQPVVFRYGSHKIISSILRTEHIRICAALDQRLIIFRNTDFLSIHNLIFLLLFYQVIRFILHYLFGICNYCFSFC